MGQELLNDFFIVEEREVAAEIGKEVLNELSHEKRVRPLGLIRVEKTRSGQGHIRNRM